VADLDLNPDESFYLSADDYSGEPTLEDPLEWLMDQEDSMNHLPESSLELSGVPIFPDFSDLNTHHFHLQPQHSSHLVDDMMEALPALADPKITVQSLLQEDHEAL
jgi:hypothetical protein